MNVEYRHDSIFFLCCEIINNVYEKVAEEGSKEKEDFIRELKKFSDYEISSSITQELSRYYLGSFKFAHVRDDMNDSFIEDDSLIIDKSLAHFYVTVHKNTRIAILMIVDPSVKIDPTSDVDQMSKNNLFFDFDNKNCYVKLSSVIEKKFGLKDLNSTRALITMKKSQNYSTEFFQSLLMGESYHSNVVNYSINSDTAKYLLKKNIRQYSFYDLFVSSKVLLFFLEDFDNYEDNMVDEISIVFICEMILLQNSAILRTNRKIVEALSKNKKISLLDIENFYIEFGATMFLREKDIYKYTLVQNLANEITNAFEHKKIMENFLDNRKHLEHIVQLKASRTAEKEVKIINVIAITLALIQVIPLISQWNKELEFFENIYIIMAEFTTVSIFILFLIYYRNFKRKQSKNN